MKTEEFVKQVHLQAEKFKAEAAKKHGDVPKEGAEEELWLLLAMRSCPKAVEGANRWLDERRRAAEHAAIEQEVASIKWPKVSKNATAGDISGAYAAVFDWDGEVEEGMVCDFVEHKHLSSEFLRHFGAHASTNFGVGGVDVHGRGNPCARSVIEEFSRATEKEGEECLEIALAFVDEKNLRSDFEMYLRTRHEKHVREGIA